MSTSKKTVPPFLTKLYHMVDDPNTNNCIAWNNAGDGFVLLNAEAFSRDVLPQYFKHNNFATFVRQLNMYDFSKVAHVETGVVTIGEFHAWHFTHPSFRRGHPEILCNIQRKTYVPPDRKPMVATDNMEELARQFEELRTENVEMRQMIGQLCVESDDLRRENRHLTETTCNTINKVHELQNTIERVVQFLASIYSPEFVKQQLSQMHPQQLQHLFGPQAIGTSEPGSGLSAAYQQGYSGAGGLCGWSHAGPGGLELSMPATDSDMDGALDTTMLDPSAGGLEFSLDTQQPQQQLALANVPFNQPPDLPFDPNFFYPQVLDEPFHPATSPSTPRPLKNEQDQDPRELLHPL